MQAIDLSENGIHVGSVLRNLSPSKLYEEAIRWEEGTTISGTGALISYSGEKTGRSPKDKRVVREPGSEDNVWWGSVNMPLSPEAFSVNRERAIDYLNTRDRLYVVDGYAGWDAKHQIKVRVVCCRPYHALFMHNMLIRPTREQLETFGEPDCVIFNAGGFPASSMTAGLTSKTSVNLSLDGRQVVILGTEYAGEMKKAVFSLMNYLMPEVGVLSMHCSATTARDGDHSAVLFGLSGTGKTTLSADPHRLLIGDDEHCWTDDGIFNIEGGCYAKAIGLTREAEPEIFDAIRFGAVLENVIYDEHSQQVDFNDTSITENTRASYPLEAIENVQIPCLCSHPNDVIFLTCDAFGVLPPVSKLNTSEAMYHFISGYTAKVAGTEVGVTEPQATFSACFGGPFLVWHPGKYANLLAERITANGANVWLVNTGWSGGPYGVGSRIKLKYTRAMISAIYSGELADAPSQAEPTFRFQVITECPGVPNELLLPVDTWADKDAFLATSRKLAQLFVDNFRVFEAGVSPDVLQAGPIVE
jgi:phosphoenolpyruvate carboxykinase (ATP)